MQNKQDYKDEIQEIIQEIKSAKKLSEVLTPKNFAPPNGWADKITRQIKKSLKTSQLRKIFAEVKDICQKKDEVQLYLLYPKLAYAEGRKLMPKNFYELLIACLDKLKENADEEDFKNFEEFMTAIVAYNKKYDK